MKLKFLSLLFISISTFSFAQDNTQKEMLAKIDQIMQGDNFVGVLPQNGRWSYDGKSIYFSKKSALEPLPTWYKQNISNGKPVGQPLKIAKNDFNINPQNYIFGGNNDFENYNKIKTDKIVSIDGDLYLQDTQNGSTKRLTNTLENERNPSFTRNDSAIVYQKGDDLFYFWLQGQQVGQTQQLTSFVDADAKAKKGLSQADKWLNSQQSDLLEIVRINKAEDSIKNAQPKPYRLTAIPLNGKYVSSVQISNDGRFVVYVLGEYSSKATEVPNYINEFGYTENLPARSKVGNSMADFSLYVYDRYARANDKIDLSALPKMMENPAFYTEYGRNLKRDSPRNLWIQEIKWSPDGKKGVLVVRADDSKDRWIVGMDLTSENEKLKLVDHQHDDAWIGGEGISGWHGSTGTLGWQDNETVYFQSEKTGFSHLYTYNFDSKKQKQLTNGNFEVTDVWLSEDTKTFYVRANKENFHEYHLYKLNLKKNNLEKITSQKGVYEELVLSPDEKFWVARYSYSNKPWELVVFDNKTNASQTQITNSITEEFKKYSWYEPKIITFKTPDGVEVPARIYEPDANVKNKAAVMFVHGAGYLQNVHYGWSAYYREYMFHNLLREQGYTVIDIDYRGSQGYGRDWRTAIYRHMGDKELIDYVAGADYLVKNHNIDKDRIGIYGGSYGGFMTMMAMFKEPKIFRSGAALRSVTDWAHYNHGYTSNILNTPLEDSLAYVRSSPIYFAEGLEGDLLICHGVLDTNVQFQDVVRLSQRLIELKKENWELAIYPIEGHGFVYPTSWADEYKRIYQLFDRTIGKQKE
ncbi:dipeptidyl aminopeptidase/acylaminoacyl peptidase [Bernardetia litoralis DSM 6794]|uniref:Dipeptidyl aminopeptidase/acylaminoacyl peptidase n=1 Tax=Bernardetia litoralis (strain ATCC 23117 / DSM 6794 / NBRC 15988 / NCIMB 1366 / Fx l1 / Sio-4) TaxID=880071 RepID=I4AQE3_BERLS|nr:prolyl oligopeptidase family serine peptidase [Bernardetia litoralis]AFM06178.1 dipeptidyl aminopeptidase/acylaminoacyl peptidase [Bernardetia litoralis DSM 6794]